MIGIMIFGASKSGEIALSRIKKEDVNILAFIDNDTNKIGTEYYGKKTIGPFDIKKYKYDYILVGGTYYKEIKEQLVGMGIKNSKIIDYRLHTPVRGTSIIKALKEKRELNKKKYKLVFKESHMALVKDNYSLLNILISAII